MSKKYKPGSEKYLDESIELLYMVMKKLFERYSGRGKKITKSDSIKEYYKKGSELKADRIKDKIRDELEKKSSPLKNEAKKLMDNRDEKKNGRQVTREGAVNLYTDSITTNNNNRTNFISNVIETVGRQIYTPRFLGIYNSSLVQDEQPIADDVEDDMGPRPAEQKEGESDKKYLKRLEREDRSKFGGKFDEETYERMEVVRERINAEKEMRRQLEIEKGRVETRKKLQQQKEARAKAQEEARAKAQEANVSTIPAQAQVKSENISDTNRSDSSDSSDYAEPYILAARRLPPSISDFFQRTDNFIRRDDETDFEYKQRLERAVNIIEGTLPSTSSQRERNDRQRIINIMNGEIKILNNRIPPPISEQITNSTLNDMARNFSTQSQNILQSPPPQVLTPAQLNQLKKRRRTLERKFTAPQKKKTAAEKTAEIVSERLTNTLLPEVKGARQNITNADIRRQEAETKATEQRNVLLQRQDQIQRTLDNINVQYPELKNQAQKVSNELKMLNRKETKQLLNNNQINDIIDAMPSQYRQTLGASIGSVLTGNANLNSIASGLLGFSTVILSGNPMIGGLVQQASQYIMNAYGVDLNNILEPPEPIPESQDPNLGEVTTAPSVQNPARQTNELEELKGEVKDEKDVKVFDDDLESIILRKQQEHVRAILEQVPQEVKESMDTTLLSRFVESYILSRYMAIQNMRQTLIQDIPFDDIYNQQQFLDYIGVATGIQQTEQNNITAEIEDGQGFLQYLRNIVPSLRDLIPPIPLDSLIERLPTLSQINRYLPTFLRFPEMKTRPARQVPQLAPPRTNINQNTMLGMVGAGGAAYARGGAMDAVGALGPGALVGAFTPSMIDPMIRRAYEQIGRDMNDPQVKREIKYMKTLSPAVVGALLGYSGAGQEYTSGAGITERKITVDPSVLEETKAVDQQEGKDPKKWATKAIMPTPDILDETQQEKFVDDLEFAAFNYIEPGSEGANGNIKTNPLKRSQFLTDQIRYMDAGISTPSMLYNVEFPTNTPQKQMDTYKLGQDMLPRMEFLVDDNADTFTPIGRHYVNNEDVSVEMFSPFSDFSDVRNYWAINRKSDLYNLYA